MPVGAAAPAAHNTSLVYIGTYTEEGSTSKGIYVYRFDASTVTITSLGLAAQTVNPSFLAVHPNHRFLYAVNEVKDYRPKERSRQRLRHQSRDRQTDSSKSSGVQGGGSLLLTVDKTGKYLLVANYSGGNVAVFPVLEDGRLGEVSRLCAVLRPRHES